MPVEFDRDEDAFFEACVDRGRLPRNDAEKQIVLERISREFDLDATYDKSEVNEVVGEFLEDFVLVRRELVNFGYLTHDTRAGTYHVEKHALSEADYRAIARLERHAKDLGVLE